MFVLLGGYGIEVGLHRYFCHRLFKTNKVIERILAYFAIMSGDGIIFPTSYHQGVHHKYADDINKDLHSPNLGFFNSYFWWQTKINLKNVNLLAARHILRDPVLRLMDKHHVLIFWVSFIVMCLISVDFAIGMFLPASILAYHQINIVDSFGHVRAFGYRNIDTNDDSVNNVITGYLFWGLGWHNNHHGNPGRMNQRIRWWEYDIAGSLLIPIIAKR
mgnify:CR=1 FL=1|jgi:fatty-acid desaturase